MHTEGLFGARYFPRTFYLLTHLGPSYQYGVIFLKKFPPFYRWENQGIERSGSFTQGYTAGSLVPDFWALTPVWHCPDPSAPSHQISFLPAQRCAEFPALRGPASPRACTGCVQRGPVLRHRAPPGAARKHAASEGGESAPGISGTHALLQRWGVNCPGWSRCGKGGLQGICPGLGLHQKKWIWDSSTLLKIGEIPASLSALPSQSHWEDSG